MAPTLQILLLLTATVGLPFFVLSSTGPLVQSWFSRSCPGRSPYRLYALSNFGSLLALVSYPFSSSRPCDSRRKPKCGRSDSWRSACCAYNAARAFTTRRQAAQAEFLRPTAFVRRTFTPTWAARFWWLALPAFASVMLLATTNHVCQDIAVIPFLWIAPLSLYLLTFIISFDHARWYWPRTTAVLAGGALARGGSDRQSDHRRGRRWIHVRRRAGGLFLGTIPGVHALPRGVARLKPDPKYLTSFYLMIAAGGGAGWLVRKPVGASNLHDVFRMEAWAGRRRSVSGRRGGAQRANHVDHAAVDVLGRPLVVAAFLEASFAAPSSRREERRLPFAQKLLRARKRDGARPRHAPRALLSTL